MDQDHDWLYGLLLIAQSKEGFTYWPPIRCISLTWDSCCVFVVELGFYVVSDSPTNSSSLSLILVSTENTSCKTALPWPTAVLTQTDMQGVCFTSFVFACLLSGWWVLLYSLSVDLCYDWRHRIYLCRFLHIYSISGIMTFRLCFSSVINIIPILLIPPSLFCLA